MTDQGGCRQLTRRYDIDWLTVLAVLTIFLYHCARFFNHEDWHVKNGQLSDGLSLAVQIVSQWVMPLFFVLSGMSSCHSLAGRKGWQYLENRTKRLLVPFLFAVLVVVIPVQVWVERVSHGHFDGSFSDFYPKYFDGFYAFGGNFAWMGLHLWYLQMLFVFTLFTLPLFALVKKEAVVSLLGTISTYFAKRGAVLLLMTPLFLVELAVNLQPEGVGMRAFGGWSPFSYLVLFVLGFTMAIDDRFTEGMVRSRYPALFFGVVTSSLLFFVPTSLGILEGQPYVVTVFLRSFNCWCWLVALLGLALVNLNFKNALLVYAREAVLPFYILHQTVIVLFGFYLLHWELSIGGKYALLSLGSFILCLAIYDLVVKRVPILRFLFGMRGVGA